MKGWTKHIQFMEWRWGGLHLLFFGLIEFCHGLRKKKRDEREREREREREEENPTMIRDGNEVRGCGVDRFLP